MKGETEERKTEGGLEDQEMADPETFLQDCSRVKIT